MRVISTNYLMSEDYLPEMTTEGYAAQKQLDKVFTMGDLGVATTILRRWHSVFAQVYLGRVDTSYP